MPPITTKTQLLEKMRESRAKLEKVIATVPAESLNQPGICGEWSGKDVLAHVAHYQEMHLSWWAAFQRGETPAVPAPGLTWSRADVDILNQQIYRAHCDQPVDQVLAYLRETYQRFLALIEMTPEIDLFTPGLVPFMGKGTLARWYIEYAQHDGFGRNQLYNAFIKKPRIKT